MNAEQPVSRNIALREIGDDIEAANARKGGNWCMPVRGGVLTIRNGKLPEALMEIDRAVGPLVWLPSQ